MPFGVIKKVIDNFEFKELVFTGGEPLLRFDLIRRAQQYLKSLKKRVNLAIRSNGTLFDEKKVEFMRDNKISLILSLDGLENSHDKHRKFKNGKSTYRKLVHNIKILKDCGVSFDFNYTVTPQTTSGLALSLLRFLEGFKVNTHLGYVIDKRPITDSQLCIYLKEILLFCHIYLQKSLFIKDFKIYPFDSLFSRSLYDGGKGNRDVLNCGFRKVCVSSNGCIYTCDSYLFIPSQYRRKIKIGDACNGSLDLKKLNYFNKDFNLSEWGIGNCPVKTNRLCYLRCSRPDSRVNLESKVGATIQYVFNDYFNNLSTYEKSQLKQMCSKKNNLIHDTVGN